MADITTKINQPVSAAITETWKDMGDGSYAKVVYAGGTGTVSVGGTATVSDAWRNVTTSDVTANDSDKSFAVTANQEWLVRSVYVGYTSGTAAGNRQLAVEYQNNAGSIIASVRAGAVQAGTLVRQYMFGLGVADLTAYRDTSFLMTPLPYTGLNGGGTIRVWDRGTISPAGDTMAVYVNYDARGTA